MTAPATLTIGQCAALACLLEAIACKPGNVHRGADFADLSFTDFAVSSALIAPVIDRAAEQSVGLTIYEAIAVTRTRVATNSNLGIVILLAPLAAVPRTADLASGVRNVLHALTPSDARHVYAAIRLAASTALGKVEQMDVAADAPQDLLQAMAAAADRDAVALQYTTDFHRVLSEVLPWLRQGMAEGLPLTMSIVHTQMQLLSRYSDSLVVRKCGAEIGRQLQVRAAAVLEGSLPGTALYNERLSDLDFWLRSDGHRRNPGTTADLIAAGLFAGFRDDLLPAPWC